MGLRQRLQELLGLRPATDIYDHGEYEEMDGYSDTPGLPSDYEDGRAYPPVAKDHSVDNVIAMPGVSSFQAQLVIMEPYSFQEVPAALIALRDRKVVVLNLGNLDADEAQRSVDYVAGGTFALNGNQERIGKCVFLFTPHAVQITSPAAPAASRIPSGYPPPPPPPPYATQTSPLSREQEMLRKLEIRRVPPPNLGMDPTFQG